MRDPDRYRSEYIANYGFERHMVKFRRRQVLACLARYPHRHLLEVGCGIEPLFEHVDQWASYCVVEPDAVFAAEARGRAPVGRDFVVLEQRLEDAVDSLAGRSFDFIVLSSVLHEVSDPARLLAAVRTLCSAETAVHVNVPNAASLHNRIAVRMGLIPDVFASSQLARQMQRTSTFDLVSLGRLLEEAGFRVEESGSYFLKPFTHGQLQAMLEQGIIDERVLDGLHEVNAEFDGLGAEIFMQVKRA